MSGLPPNVNLPQGLGQPPPIASGAGPGPAGLWGRLIVSPGQRLSLGSEGGTLLLAPPGAAPGSMSFAQMQNKVWHLLRENGPYTGYPVPTSGDFSQAVVQDDLNLALAQFISDTGIAPDLCDRMDSFPVFPVLDYPLPPGLVSLTGIDYTPAGMQTYSLSGLSMREFDQYTGGLVPIDTGQPYYYREPFAGYVRLTPQPSIGNAQGPGLGAITLGGTLVPGQSLSAYLSNPGVASVVVSYGVQAGDSLSSAAFNLSALINNSAAVTGPNAFLQPTQATSNVINLASLLAPGTQITYYVSVTNVGFELGTEGGAAIGIEGGGVIGIEGQRLTPTVVLPPTATGLAPSGDIITFYYSSLGTVLSNNGDVPGIPPQFHVALVYRVLGDYWERKQDPKQAASYMAKYEAAVRKATSFTFDSNKATNPTLASDVDEPYTLGVW